MGSLKKIGKTEVLWEVESFAADFARAKSGGYFDLSGWETISISGPDAWDYLHRMSTLGFKNWPVGKAAPGAFLTGKAVPVVWGYFIKVAIEQFLFLVPPGQGELAYEHIEKFHFSENLEVADVSPSWRVFGLWMPNSAVLASGFSWPDSFRESLTWRMVPVAEVSTFQTELELAGFKQLGYRLFEFFRIDAGLILVGTETTDKTLALEAGLDKSITPQKGCYPGQEVVERINTYGRVNRRLARMEITGVLPALPTEITTADGRPAGTLVAAEVLPDDPSRGYGIAYVNRAFLDSPDGQGFSIPGGSTARLR